MKSPGDDVEDVEDDVLDENLIEERTDWEASDWDDEKDDRLTCSAVSYTHLTLPTICSV